MHIPSLLIQKLNLLQSLRSGGKDKRDKDILHIRRKQLEDKQSLVHILLNRKKERRKYL